MREKEDSHELISFPITQPRLISDNFGNQKRQDYKTVDEVRFWIGAGAVWFSLSVGAFFFGLVLW